MSSYGHHIINKCKWHTLLDQQDMSHELQETISQWSAFQLHREADEVLRHFNISQTTIRLNTVEIDLGIMEMDELSGELSQRFKEKFKEKLIDIVFHHSDPELAIVRSHGQKEYLETLRHYLLTGVFPWHGTSNLELDQLVTNQFLADGDGFVALVREMGEKDVVRKRIAWQFKEVHINKLIKGLEPGNYEFISKFTKSLTSGQKKDRYVTQNLSSFKRDVWFWTLTYLLVERGSVFNTTSYIRSSIVQLANTYHTEYNSILQMIAASLRTIDTKSTGVPLIINILDYLCNETSSSKGRLMPAGATNEVIRFAAVKNARQANDLYLKFIKSKGRDHLIRLMNKEGFQSFFLKLSRSNKLGFLKQLNNQKSDYAQLLSLMLTVTGTGSSLPEAWNKVLDIIPLQQKYSLQEIFDILKEDSKKHRKSSILLEECLSWIESGTIYSLQTAIMMERFIYETISKSSGRHKKILRRQLDQMVMRLLTGSTLEVSMSVSRLLHLWILLDPGHLTSRLLCLPEEQLVCLIRELQEPDRELLHQYLAQSDKSTQKVLNERLANHNMGELSETLVNSQINLNGKGVEFIRKLILKAIEEDNRPMLLVMITQLSHGHSAMLRLKENDFQKIYHYLIKNATKGSEQFLAEIKLICNNSTKNTKWTIADIRTLMLQCLTDYHHYRGDYSEFKFLVREVIEDRLDIQKRTVSEPEDASVERLINAYVQCIESRKTKVEVGTKKINFNELQFYLLEAYPENIRILFGSKNFNRTERDFLKKHVSLSSFLALLFADVQSSQSRIAGEIIFLIQLIEYFVESSNIKWRDDFWEKILNGLSANLFDERLLQELVEHFLSLTSIQDTPFNSQMVNEKLASESTTLPPILSKILALHNVFGVPQDEKPTHSIHSKTNSGIAQKVFETSINDGKLPAWFMRNYSDSSKRLFNELFTNNPLDFLRVYRKHSGSIAKVRNLLGLMESNQLFEVLIRLYPGHQTILNELLVINKSIGSIRELDSANHHILSMILSAWSNHQWDKLDPARFWQELMHQVCLTSGPHLKVLFNSLSKISTSLPVRYRISLNELLNRNEESNTVRTSYMNSITKDKSMPKRVEKLKLPETGIIIPNAGIVILNGYFKMLFERLKLLDGDQFKDYNCQMAAVHFLQCIAIGHAKSKEPDLVLNKILTGIPIEEPIAREFEIKDAEEEIMEGMLEAAIKYWASVGKSSIHGFRGNWFVRDGLLYEQEDYWNLVVEKRAYDVLLNHSPFSFSIIKFPWMPKPLKVEWPY